MISIREMILLAACVWRRVNQTSCVPGDHQVFIGLHHAHGDQIFRRRVGGLVDRNHRGVRFIALWVEMDSQELEAFADPAADR